MELQERINDVAINRETLKGLKEQERLSLTAWTEANKNLRLEVETAQQMVIDSENILRKLTLEAYNETANKKPAEGVGIRITKRLLYDAAKALEWAKEHNLCLRLDLAAFERLAKTEPINFVITEEIPQATIATNLEVK